jgi:hypothetical protein
MCRELGISAYLIWLITNSHNLLIALHELCKANNTVYVFNDYTKHIQTGHQFFVKL